jgi:hypothetical protein
MMPSLLGITVCRREGTEQMKMYLRYVMQKVRHAALPKMPNMFKVPDMKAMSIDMTLPAFLNAYIQQLANTNGYDIDTVMGPKMFGDGTSMMTVFYMIRWIGKK